MHSGLAVWFTVTGSLWLICPQYSNFMVDLSTGYFFYLKMPNYISLVYLQFIFQQNNWKRRAEHENTPVNTLMYVFRNIKTKEENLIFQT